MKLVANRFVALALVLSALVAARAEPSQPAGALVIHDVTIIDVEAGKAIPHRSIFIEGDRIVRIVDAATAQPPEGATVIDGRALHAMPGLFDAHVHISADPGTFVPMLVAHGVVCVRDTGAPTDFILEMKRSAAASEDATPDIVCTGAIIDGDPPVWPFSEPCDTPEEARAAVRKLHEAGVDQIKVYSRLQPEVYRAAVEEAHVRGLKATGHVPDGMTLEDALVAKQDCTEHLMGFPELIVSLAPPKEQERDMPMWAKFAGFMRYPDADQAKLKAFIERVRAAGMVQCPTMVVFTGIGRAADDAAMQDPKMEYVSEMMRAFWGGENYKGFASYAAAAVPHMQSLVRDLHQAGVPLMIGTDLANPFVFAGFAVHEEMELFAKAGIPTADVLRSATIVPARFCGVDDRLGSIAEGKLASLVLVRGNPLEDVSRAREIQTVILRGRALDRKALDGLLEEAKAAAKSSRPLTDAAVKLEMPGRELHRGRYTMKFQQFDAGSETFVITEDEAGYHVAAHSQPQGGFQAPAYIAAHADKTGVVQRAEWRQLTEDGPSAEYVSEGGKARATAKAGGKELEPEELAIPANGVLSPPASATEFLFYRALALKESETREVQAISFGYPGWELSATPMTVTREPDAPLELGAGRSVTARVYLSRMQTEMGAMENRAWTDESGLLLKSEMKAPFGTITVTLEPKAP